VKKRKLAATLCAIALLSTATSIGGTPTFAMKSTTGEAGVADKRSPPENHGDGSDPENPKIPPVPPSAAELYEREQVRAAYEGTAANPAAPPNIAVDPQNPSNPPARPNPPQQALDAPRHTQAPYPQIGYTRQAGVWDEFHENNRPYANCFCAFISVCIGAGLLIVGGYALVH
jgi:hypothetical protein